MVTVPSAGGDDELLQRVHLGHRGPQLQLSLGPVEVAAVEDCGGELAAAAEDVVQTGQPQPLHRHQPEADQPRAHGRQQAVEPGLGPVAAVQLQLRHAGEGRQGRQGGAALQGRAGYYSV